MNLKKMMQGLVFFLTSLLVFVFLFRALLPTASPRMTKPKTAAKEITYTYVALGDSLTEGVGDSTKQGGFVPILAQSLSNENDGQYQPVNYGVAGNTSAQILDRLKKQTDLQKDLKKARVMTLTVGGNDLRKVVVDHLSDFSLSDIRKPLKNYTANLKEMRRQKKPSRNLIRSISFRSMICSIKELMAKWAYQKSVTGRQPLSMMPCMKRIAFTLTIRAMKR